MKQFLELTAGGAGAVDAALVVNGQDLRQGLSAGRHHRVAAGLDLHALADAGGGGVYQLAIRLYDADAGVIHILDALQIVERGNGLPQILPLELQRLKGRVQDGDPLLHSVVIAIDLDVDRFHTRTPFFRRNILLHGLPGSCSPRDGWGISTWEYPR